MRSILVASGNEGRSKTTEDICAMREARSAESESAKSFLDEQYIS